MAAADLDIMDEAEALLALESQILLSSEKEVRMRCDGLTPLESKNLRGNPMWGKVAWLLTDAEKVQTFFGLANGGTAACKRLLKFCHEHKPAAPGKVAQRDDVEFTLGKHLLLADRRQRLKDGLPDRHLPCKCLAATYMMTGGCVHTKQALWKVATLQNTLCPTCSSCLRCKKFLACFHWV